jgi:hypothetical protein
VNPQPTEAKQIHRKNVPEQKNTLYFLNIPSIINEPFSTLIYVLFGNWLTPKSTNTNKKLVMIMIPLNWFI